MIDAEQSIIGALLSKNDTLDRLDGLKTEHFASEVHREIYAEILRQLLAGKAVDALTVADVLKDQLQYLTALQANASPNLATRYAKIVIDSAKTRSVQLFALEATALANDDARPVDARLEALAGMFASLMDSEERTDSIFIADSINSHFSIMTERIEGKRSFMPTHIPDLDRYLGGGLREGNLFVIGARPSMGKTALGLTIALRMAQDRPVGFLSMEMSHEEINDRVLANLGSLALGKVKNPQETDDEFWARAVGATEKVQRMRLWVDQESALTLERVRSKVRMLKRKHGLKVLVVDYLQLMHGRDDKMSRAYQLEEISRGLKTIAKDNELAVIALAQVNRKSSEGLPGLADLKDSGAIEQDADIVGFIHRPIQIDPALPSEFYNFAQFFLAKNRQGRTGEFPLFYAGEYTRFDSWEGPAPKIEKRRSIL